MKNLSSIIKKTDRKTWNNVKSKVGVPLITAILMTTGSIFTPGCIQRDYAIETSILEDYLILQKGLKETKKKLNCIKEAYQAEGNQTYNECQEKMEKIDKKYQSQLKVLEETRVSLTKNEEEINVCKEKISLLKTMREGVTHIYDVSIAIQTEICIEEMNEVDEKYRLKIDNIEKEIKKYERMADEFVKKVNKYSH